MTEPPSPSPYELAEQAAAALAEKTGIERHDVALVLGSGWLPAVDALGEATAEIATTDLPGFSAAAVAGHSGKIRSVRSGDKQLLVFLSRTHYYEGKGVACGRARRPYGGQGGLPRDRAHQRLRRPQGDLDARHARPHLRPHQPDRPLPDRGRELRRPHRPLLQPPLRAMCREVDPLAGRGRVRPVPRPALRDPRRDRHGPRTSAAHLDGVSTTLEAIAAREAGMEILGISLVTNLAAGISGEPLNHEEVLEAGKTAAARMGELLVKSCRVSDADGAVDRPDGPAAPLSPAAGTFSAVLMPAPVGEVTATTTLALTRRPSSESRHRGLTGTLTLLVPACSASWIARPTRTHFPGEPGQHGDGDLGAGRAH